MKTTIVTILLFAFMGNAYSQTSIEGKVRDSSTFEPIIFAGVALYKNGVLITGAETDLDGNFLISDIQPGKYDIEIVFLGYKTKRVKEIICKANQISRLIIEMESEPIIDCEIICPCFYPPLIEIDNMWSGTIITSEKIRTLPRKTLP